MVMRLCNKEERNVLQSCHLKSFYLSSLILAYNVVIAKTFHQILEENGSAFAWMWLVGLAFDYVMVGLVLVSRETLLGTRETSVFCRIGSRSETMWCIRCCLKVQELFLHRNG